MLQIIMPIIFTGVALAMGLALDLFGFEAMIVKISGLPANSFGPLFLAYVLNVVLLNWMGLCVGKARRKYGVKYPNMYAVKSDDNKYADEFNCIQRAHQNTLEQQSQFFTVSLITAVRFPVSAAALSFLYLFGRVLYALGYQTGNPSNRYAGMLQYFGFLPMMGLSLINGLYLSGIDINALAGGAGGSANPPLSFGGAQ